MNDVTQWYREHPNNGWIPCTPCEATSSLCLLQWRVSLGVPWDKGRIVTATEMLLFGESCYWEAKQKGILNNETCLWNLTGTVAERLELSVSDDVRLSIVRGIFGRR